MTKLILNVKELLDGLMPMLAMTCEEDLTTLVGTHVFDQKVDGVRTLLARQDGELIIRNRNDKDRTAIYPEIEAAATFDLPDGLALDGEIVSTSGVFGDIQRRDKQRTPEQAARLAVEVPAKFIAFDILHHPDEGDVRHLPWVARRRLLEDIVPSTSRFETTLASPDPDFYEQIKALGGEGVVAKRMQAPYGIGRKKDWLKYKTTRTVSAIAVKYEAGKGAREEIGALLLAMVNDEGTGSYVGKVGSGFKAEDLTFLKDQLDSALCPVIEVEVLGRTKNNLLRQPVFKGVRSDLAAHEVRINQLNALPKG